MRVHCTFIYVIIATQKSSCYQTLCVQRNPHLMSEKMWGQTLKLRKPERYSKSKVAQLG